MSRQTLWRGLVILAIIIAMFPVSALPVAAQQEGEFDELIFMLPVNEDGVAALETDNGSAAGATIAASAVPNFVTFGPAYIVARGV